MYFAQIDFFRKVLKIIAADQDFVNTLPGLWIQCDYNGISPKNYPAVGHIYDYERNAFLAPKQHPSWILNEVTCRWEAPVQMPSNGQYAWNEETQSWQPIE